MCTGKKLVLASGSPSRLELLKVVGFTPARVLVTDIDETPLKKEKPRDLALRLAIEKCKKAELLLGEKHDVILLSADTVVAVGRRIVDKALSDDDVYKNIKFLSGRNHRIYSAFSVFAFDKNGTMLSSISKVVQARVMFKHLSDLDIRQMVASKEGIGKAGGYALCGFASSFVIKVVGMPSSIIGLPVYNVRNTLLSFGCTPDIGVVVTG